MAIHANRLKGTMLWHSIIRWFDSYDAEPGNPSADARQIDWIRTIPFIAMHLACFGVLWVGWSPVAVMIAIGLYAIRMFAITGFYHRYFSHRAFKTNRLIQFIFAFLGASAVQRGPLWWASHHRHHHACADKGNDPHSPDQHGLFWSHTGWFLSQENFSTRHERIKDFSRFPELRLLDRFDILVPLALAISLYIVGEWLGSIYPELHTNGLQMLVWGVISTVVLYHVTFTINSLAHSYGSRRYETKDSSRNNVWLALLTFGEGWHNNHHYYPGSARQGFFWWEIDITYYVLVIMEKLGLIHDLRPVPARILQQKGIGQ
jgi:stearoyl-CoA desaturase (delta-9 desaturase)